MSGNDRVKSLRMVCVVTLTAGIVVAGCVGATADEPPVAEFAVTPGAVPEAVPWEAVDRFADAGRGSYVKRFHTNVHGESAEISSETVRFDRDVAFIDRTIPVPGSGELRFLYTEDAVLMRNPSAEEKCGTPWVDMGSVEDLTASAIGVAAPAAEMLTLEPLDILESADADPVVVSNTDVHTVYELVVPGGTGVGLSSALMDDPDKLETMLALEHKALITVPRSAAPLIIDVDATNVLTALGEDVPAGASMTITWEVETDTVVDTTLPTNVADMTCMN